MDTRFSKPFDGPSHGFTLTELIAMTGLLALLAATLAPTLARVAPNTKAFHCQNNLRQVTAAWAIYSADYGDRVANNSGVDDTVLTIQSGRLETWANNNMTWTASTTISDVSNTNVAWLKGGGLGIYTGRAIDAYRCPSDVYLSPVQRAAGWPSRLRSISMNCVFGLFSTTSSNPGGDPTTSGHNWAFSQFVQYLKKASVPKPQKTWLLIDEHPDSINCGYFVNNPTSYTSWQDIPASYHDGGCGISFVDGHTELKRWQSPTSWYRVQYAYPATRSFDTLGRADFAWYLSRTGWVSASTGQPQFGY